jgi:hypothetical protein
MKYPTVPTTDLAIAAALAPEKQDWFETKVLSRLTADEETGCLNWTGGKNPGGYGVVGVTYLTGRSTMVLVHRLMWARVKPLPRGARGHKRNDMLIDHKCNNRACANVDHMSLVPHYLLRRRLSIHGR